MKEKGANRKQAIRLYRQGLAMVKQGKLKEASEFYQQAVQQDATFRPPYMHLGAAHARRDQAKAALPYFIKAYEIKADAIVCFNLGSSYFKLADYDKCCDYMQQYLQFDATMLKA